MDYFFLKNWYLYGSTFKFCGGTSLPKPDLSNSPGVADDMHIHTLPLRKYKVSINGDAWVTVSEETTIMAQIKAVGEY